MNIVKIGVIGCANIAQRYVIPAILSLKDKFILSGLASRTKDKAEKFGLEYNTKSFVGYETMLNELELDAVYIPLPNSLHKQWIEKALEKNIHVFVEKSLSCNYEDVVSLNEMASKKKLVLLENFQFLFHKQLSVIKSVLEDGKIGELRCLKSSFGFPPLSKNNIRYNKALGGGSLLDVGVYPIKIAQEFLGSDIQASSSSLFIDKKRGVDIWGGAFLKKTNSPLFAEIAFGFDNHYLCNLELWGSKGILYANRIFTSPPGHLAEIIINTGSQKDKIIVKPTNHFEQILIHFFHLINEYKDRHCEYENNINQSKIIQQVKIVANEK